VVYNRLFYVSCVYYAMTWINLMLGFLQWIILSGPKVLLSLRLIILIM